MRQFSFFASVLLIISSSTHSEYAPNIPLDAHRDAVIERLSSNYCIPLPGNFFAQPMQANELALFCKQADSLALVGKLTAHERIELQRIERSLDLKKPLYTYSRPTKDTRLQADLLLDGQLDIARFDSNHIFAKGVIKPRLSGNIQKFSYYSGLDVWSDYQSDTQYVTSSYQPYKGIPYNLYNRARASNLRSSDILSAGINYTSPSLLLEMSVDKLKYGPAVFMPLHFSGIAPPILYFRGILDLGPVTYYHTYGQLLVEKGKEKFLYNHRLSIPLLHNKATFGINESIVYGSTTALAQTDSLRKDRYGMTRTWSWIYMIPFVPFWFAQNYMGDQDNAIMSFDLSVQIPNNFRWYGELFIDDMTNPWSFYTNDWGNKIAYTLGGRYFTTLWGTDATISAEYAHVEPWVYTHFFGASHNFSHFNSNLGASIGPNADNTVLSIETFPLKALSSGISLTLTRNGVGRGSSIYDIFQDTAYSYQDTIYRSANPDSWKKTFLGQSPLQTFQVALFGRWDVAPFMWIDYSVFGEAGTKKGGGVSLKGHWDF